MTVCFDDLIFTAAAVLLKSERRMGEGREKRFVLHSSLQLQPQLYEMSHLSHSLVSQAQEKWSNGKRVLKIISPIFNLQFTASLFFLESTFHFSLLAAINSFSQNQSEKSNNITFTSHFLLAGFIKTHF